MKGTLFGLSKAWNNFKISKLQVTTDDLRNNVRLSINRINQDLAIRCSNTLKAIANLCYSKPTETDDTPKTNTVNLFGAPGYPHTRRTLLDAPKLSFDERLSTMRQGEAKRKERETEYRAKMLNGNDVNKHRPDSPKLDERILNMRKREVGRKERHADYTAKMLKGSNIKKRRRDSPSVLSQVSRKSRTETDLHPPKRRSKDEQLSLSLFAEIRNDLFLIWKEIEEKKRQKTRRGREEDQSSATNAYHDWIPPRLRKRGPSNEGPKKFSSEEENERRRKNWLAGMSRTKDGKLIAYGCGRRYDWEKEWEKKKRLTPDICGKKRKRVYTFESFLEERRPVRRRTGLTSLVFVNEPRSTAFPVFYFNPYEYC